MKRLVVTGCAAVFACAANAGVVDSVDTLIGGSTAAHVPGGTHPYGVCAHITGWGEPLAPTMNAMELAGMRYVRADFDAWTMKNKNGEYDFTRLDKMVADLDARGMKMLPIIWGKNDRSVPKDMEEFSGHVKKIVSHFGKKIPVVEIWNEPNLNGFFKGADPVEYAKVLKVAYEAVKSVDPSIRVAYAGTASIPLNWIRKSFEAGAAECFDVMNVHPYTHPRRPEGIQDVDTDKLKALLAEFGRAEAPIWFTEIGWPTHEASMPYSGVLRAGLKVARPNQKTWNVVIADNRSEGEVGDQSLCELVLDLLPAGSRVRKCSQKETCRLLSEGGVDAVMYPNDETFPADTIDAVNEFVAKGGVLIDFGGIPCYFGRRGDEEVAGMQHGGALARFPFGHRAWWSEPKGAYPERTWLHTTEAGRAAGLKQDPAGFRSDLFLAPDRIGEGSEWIPLIAGKTDKGVELVSAAVIRYKGERKGAAVLCSLLSTASGTTTEENQARYTARGMGLAFAQGIEAFFTYNLRAGENDTYFSEDHFGLMHSRFQPKPAFAAYANFTRERPAGSVQKAGAWHDEKRTVYHPQWTRPDGTKAGMLWTVGKDVERTIRFTGGAPTFRNMYGRKIAVREVEKGVYKLKLTGSPVYFSGAELAGL